MTTHTRLRRRASGTLALLTLLTPAAPLAAQNPAATPPVELEADRAPKVTTEGSVLLKGATLLTVTNGVIENGDLLIRDGKIAAVGKNLTAPQGIPTFDVKGKWVTPGIVDAHSHLASDATNEGTDSVTAEVRIQDVLNPESISLFRALSNGVTTSLVLHGSANAIGGQSSVIKLKWKRPVEELLFPGAPRIIKFALGENVKRSGRQGDGPGRYPTTRLGVETVYRRAFLDARRYMAEWDAYEKARASDSNAAPPRRDLRLETLTDILKGNIWVHCHSYRADEMLMMLRISKEFGFKLAALQHALEAYKIAPEIKEAGVGVSTFADEWGYKVEAFDAIPHNAAMCVRAGIVTSVNSDNGSGTAKLNLEAAKCRKFGGLSENEALRLITLNAAMQLGIEKRVGSLDVGKDGDIAVWDGYPLSNYSRCAMTLVDGRVFFTRRDAFHADAVAVTQRAPVSHTDPTPLPLPAESRAYAIVGATVHPVTGPDIVEGTVVVEDGKIKAVGKGITIPRGAAIVRASGLHVYPGMIDAGSTLGLYEIGQTPATIDNAEQGDFQPDLLALSAVNPASEHLAITRNGGVTTSLTRPTGGLVAGRSSVINLAGWTPDQMVVTSPALLHVAFPEGAGSVPRAARDFLADDFLQRLRDQEKEQIDKLRDSFARAKRYSEARAQTPPTVPEDPRQEAMVPFATGRKPVAFEVSSARGIRKAVAFAEEMGLKPVIYGGREAWKAADLLAAKKVPVVYELPASNSIASSAPQTDYDPYDTVFAAPGVLARAGVPLAFQSDSATLAKNLPSQVGIACAYGLSHADALKALTLGAARILGVDNALGGIEPGKIANLIVTDGDPLEVTTSVRALFVAGRPIPIESKHTRQYRTYLPRITPTGGTSTKAVSAHR